MRTGLEARQRGDVNDEGVVCCAQPGDEPVGKIHDRVHIHLNHVHLPAVLELGEGTALTEAGIVDQALDAPAFVFDALKHLVYALRAGEIGRLGVHGDAVRAAHIVRDVLQAIRASGDEDQVFALLRELPCKRLANADAGARNQYILHGCPCPLLEKLPEPGRSPSAHTPPRCGD